MAEFFSFLAPLIADFVYYRQASGRWNDSHRGNLARFDRHCAARFPGAASLSQDMVDTWCRQRVGETGASCRTRAAAVVAFVRYMRERSLTDVADPALPPWERSAYVPHPFTEAELGRFFAACDALPGGGNDERRSRRITVPVFFRLLYSSGIRTTEARLLRTRDVNLEEGTLDIRRSKGPDQHHVALHPSMAGLMGRYDQAISALRPGRSYFFPARRDSFHTAAWVQANFRELWDGVNAAHATPYELRHHYAVANINQWTGQGLDFGARLLYLSKSMGHTALESTRRYYSLVPALGGIMEDLAGPGFDEIVPEPCDA
ncbi:MAG: tyrosine-type recombinase/integrase [Bifidobacteriaceae bacterium]|nr:tyrosine-type recombinase/integrase [Bifidobacteriaceae bacterium]